MEMALNAVWLLVAVAAMVWLPRWRRAPRDGSRARDLLVVVCFAALLFPVISMTDDLQALQMASEEAPSNHKRLLRAADPRGACLGNHCAPALTLIFALQNPTRSAIDLLVSEPQPLVSSLSLCRASGRAPPFISCS
jgi:hypothetical protein